MIRHLQILLLLFFIYISEISAQLEKLHYEHTSLGETASQNTVMAILQDQQGFMWFGTSEGLHRFDGYELKTFTSQQGDSNSLTDDNIYRLMEDSKGKIWIATRYGGVNVYNPVKETFHSYQYDPKNPKSISHNNVSAFHEDSDGVMWIGTLGGGLNKFDPKKQSFISYRFDRDNPTSLKQDYVTNILEDDEGNLWIGLGGYGIDKFNKNQETFTNYQIQLDDATKTFRSNVVRDLYDDGEGNLWAATYLGLNKLDKTTDSFTHWEHDPSQKGGLVHSSLHKIIKGENNTLWISTYGGGIQKFYLQEETFSLPEDLHGAGRNLFTSYRDNTGVIWLGTDARGVYRYYDTPKFGFNALSGLKGFVSKVFIDQQRRKWFGTVEGGIYLDINDTITNIKSDQGLSQNNIENITQGSKNNIWIGTNSGGLNALDLTTGEVKIYRFDLNDPKSLYHDTVFTTYADPDGNLWIGTAAGISFFNEKDKEFIRASTGIVRDMLLVDKILWVASDRGLFFYQVDRSKKYISQVPSTININSILHRKINCIFRSNRGDIFLGTNGGLNQYDAEAERFIDFHQEYNIPYVKVMAITQDQNDDYWMLTSKGLLYINPVTKNFEFFDQSDGINFRMNSKSIHFDASNNKILIGGIGGYYAFNPNAIIKNSYKPPLVLTDMKIFNESVATGKAKGFSLDKTINFKKNIELSYKEDMISFEFAALNYKSPEKNQYAYKLKGFDKDWIYTDASRRFATYTNLDSGDYTFLVKGSNNDGLWNDAVVSLQLNINPPPWKTWWAYILYGIILLSLLFFARRQVIRRERLKSKLQLEQLMVQKMQEVNTLKSQFFANISHEFRTPLTLILGPLEKMLSQKKDTDDKLLRVMHQNAKRLLRLINQLLDLSCLETGKLQLQEKETALMPFIKAIISSFDSLASHKDMYFEKQFPNKDIIAQIDSDKLEKILYNILSNAFKFTPEKGEVSIIVSLNKINPKKDLLVIKVNDSGKGIESEELNKIFERFYRTKESVLNEVEGSGIGLALIKELVELMQGTITVTSEIDVGTSFHLQIPIKILSDNSVASIYTERQKQKTPEGFPLEEIEPCESIKPIILIVEDNPDLRNYIKDCLGNLEYQFVEAGNGKEGFEKAKEIVPDMIISDLMMPEMNGIELCKSVKTNERTNHIPFIMLTAKVSQEAKAGGLEIGADDYITKPFDRKELVLKTKNIIHRQKVLQEKFKKELLTEPTERSILAKEDQFIDKLKKSIEKSIDNSELSVKLLSKELAMSRVQLYRKTQAITGISPSDFIRVLRLKKASQLLCKHNNVSDVAYTVGFNNLSYFTKCFKEMYGYTPSEYTVRIQQTDSHKPT